MAEGNVEALKALAAALADLNESALAAGVAGKWASALRRAAAEVERRSATARAPGAEPAAGPDIPARFGIVGDSPVMHKVFDLLERVAPSDVTVLVQGETGTGKELIARALHENGPRSGKPLVAENCAAVPAGLLESELFGHKKGSFTGAIADRPGHFVFANGGTVFLDEIGDMPMEMQAKLLRVLQDGEVRPVGSNQTIKVDVRVIAATNKDLPEACRERTFREDLYFRLNVITIALPPLREREGDVEHLVNWFTLRMEPEVGRRATFTPGALDALRAWRWPGNVRELENEIRRAVALTSGPITREDLSPRILASV